MLLVLLTLGGWLIIYFVLNEREKAAARALCGPNCACVGAAIGYLGWTGTVHSFEIASRQFALRFMLANRHRLLNVDYSVLAELDQLEAQLSHPTGGVIEIRMLAPTAAASTGVEERLYLEALERLEKQKGTASRRAHVEAVLAKLTSPALREKLALEASRIEVQAVLEKVDSLKTPSAKRRHLSNALAAIRADSVPDALQAQEIAWLEDALGELDARSG